MPDPSQELSFDAPLPKWLEAGRFILHEQVGAGGVARVFRATDSQQRCEVAIKLFQAPILDKDKLATRFLAEARVMNQLRHPNLVRVFAVGKEQGYYWYAMEYLPGGTLRDYIDSHGALTVDQGLTWIGQLLDALVAVHATGTVHRDVKPRNILLDQQGHVRLLDFGLARHPTGSVPFETIEDLGMGTIEWSAPEQLEDARSVSPAADIYAVGATAAYVLTGLRPGMMLQRLSTRAGPFATLDPALVDVITRSTAWEPQQRYPDAPAMLEALSPWRRVGMAHRIRSWFRW